MNGIEQVLKEVTEQRELLEGRLINLKAAEENLLAFLDRGRQPELPLEQNLVRQGLNPYKVAVTRRRNGTKAVRQKSADVLRRVKFLPSPFGRTDVAQACELTPNGATSQINRWAAKGYVKRVAPGQYEKTKTFPKTDDAGQEVPTPGPSPSARVRIPGLDEDRASLEEKLQQALKERDEAVRSGRETMAKILQDKVNKLQDKLGET